MEITSIIGGILILAFVIVAILIRLKNKPTQADKDSAKQFLEGLEDVFYAKMIDIVTCLDISKYGTLEEFEADILSNIYESVWKYVEEQLSDQAKTDVLTALALKVLNKEFVDSFVAALITKYNINDKINTVWVSNFEEKCKSIEEAETESSTVYTDSELYNESFNDELEKAKEVVPTEEELAALNPPTEEEEVYSDEDESVELIEDDEYYYDANGRKRDKATGRYVK